MKNFHKPLRLNKPWLTLFMSNYIAKSTSSFIAVIVLKLSIFVIANAITNLLLTTSVRGQSFSNSGSVSRNSPAAARDVRQEDQIHSSKIQDLSSTQAADLILEWDKVALTKSPPTPPISVIILPGTSDTNFSLESNLTSKLILAQQEEQQEEVITAGDIVIPISTSFGFGSVIFPPSALNGLTRRSFILPSTKSFNTLPISLHYQQKLGDSQKMLLQAGGIDPQVIAFDLSYTIAPKSLPGAFSTNLIYQSTLSPAFQDDDVTLPQGGDAWVNGIGGGIEYLQSVVPNLDLAVGVNYQKVSVRSGMFSNEIEPVDEFGNQLTVSSTGQDDVLTLKLAFLYQNLNNLNYPDQGFRGSLDIEQSIPVGDASISSTLLATSLSQFIRFGSAPKPSSLVLNLQGGTILGDATPYGSFNLGGRKTVRGFRTGRISTGKSFIQATAEYRIPIFSFNAFKEENDVLLNLFFDYGTDLGTADQVIGKPAIVRDRPGDGFGYGLGVQWRSRFGLFKLEGGLNDQGNTEFALSGGTRF